uniref:Uncharacterized protein n=1 Tax=Fundulus heteroclitus TaxID=8078 RepID=A0A3Q2PU67_FUNHE
SGVHRHFGGQVPKWPLGAVGELDRLVEKGRESEGPTESPDRRAEDPAALPLLAPVGVVGAHDHEVPIDAYASQKDDARVEVGFDNQVEELAHEVAEEPSADMGYGKEGERQGHDQNLPAGADHPSHQQISWDGQ